MTPLENLGARLLDSGLIRAKILHSWMGVLENTRGYFFLPRRNHIPLIVVSLGDLRFKKFGVTAEPEVRTKLLDGMSLQDIY